jgi:tripartite-type tricarboxylate transporter receptor subunit TctC
VLGYAPERRYLERRLQEIEKSAITRPYLLPPGTPNDRVQILRKAFAATMKDEDFLGEIQRLKLEINPMTGEELETVVNRIFKMTPETLAKLKEALR